MTNHKPKSNGLVALADAMPELRYRENALTQIKVTIARLKAEPNYSHPVNWRLDYEESKSSTGGCFARIFAAQRYGTNEHYSLFSHYGPEISYGDDHRDYEHGARAIKSITDRMDAMYATRGPAVDTADSMGRWLEASGITKVWHRPEEYRDSGWLSEGEWQQASIGSFVSMVRARLPETLAKRDAAEVQEREAQAQANTQPVEVA